MYSPRVSDASPVTRRTARQARSWGSHTTTITPPPAPVDHLFQTPQGAATTTTPAQRGGGCPTAFDIFPRKGRQSSLSLSDSATLCSRELPTATPQPPTLLHTDSLGDTDRERRKGGGVTQLLPHCAICPALSVTGALQKEQLSICKSTYSLPFFFFFPHTLTYILQILTTLIYRKESRIKAGN